MKKVLLVILVVALLLALATVVAVAATSASDAVVSVNGVKLTAEQTRSGVLQEVIDDCIAGGTIEVLANFSAPSITLGANPDGDAAKWVIKGNGYTVTDSDNTQRDSTSHTSFFIEIADAIVEINDLTIKTYASGIRANKTHANITLNNVNVYAGGTVSGTTVTNITTTSESTLKRYAFALYFRGADDDADKRYGKTLDNISLRINGGEYKTLGADGSVMYLRGTSTVVTDGTFVGEDCTYVAWVYGVNNTKAFSDVTSSLSVHKGLFIRPVSGGKAVGSNNPDAAVGGVIRVTNGALFNAYGGTYVNCDGTVPTTGKAPASSVICFGTSATAGIANIYGGDFYQLSEVGSTSGELIAHILGTMDTAANTATMIDLCRTTIWGGNFYYREGLPNANIDAIVAAKSDSSITSNDNSTIQRATWSDFSVSATEGSVTKSVYGKEYNDLKEIKFSYSGTSSGKKLKVVTAEGRTYYTSDATLAVNSIAGNGSTISLIGNITTSSKIFALARNITLNINGIGSTYEWNFDTKTDYWQGFWWRAGNIKYDGKIRLKIASSADAVIWMGLPDDSVERPIAVTVSLGDVRMPRGASQVYRNVGVAEGSFKSTSGKVNYSGSSSYTNYKVTETFATNTAKPKDIKVKTNLTLYNDLILNFYVSADDGRVKTFTVGGVTYDMSEAPVMEIDGASYYKVSHSRMSASDAMCRVPYGCTYESKGGYFTYSAESSYSVIDYANNIQKKDTDATSKALVSAIVAYIDSAYRYFGSSVATDSELAAVEAYLSAYPVSIPDSISDGYATNSAGIKSVVSELTFDLGSSAVKLLLRVADPTAPLSVGVGEGTFVSYAAGHGKEIVEVNIRAFDLGKKITITSGNLVGTYSLGKYYEDVMRDSTNEDLSRLLVAMYSYGEAAYAYKCFKEGGVVVNYNVVYPEGDSHAQQMAELFARYVAAERSESYAVVSDAEPESEHEILVGKTNRTAYIPECPDGSYAIAVSGGKISLYGADDFNVDMAVLYTLENLVLGSGSSELLSVGDGYTRVAAEENSLGAYIQFERIVSDELTYAKEWKYSKYYLYSDGTVTTSSSYVGDGTATKVCEMPQTQGAGTDGEYIYIVTTDKNDGAVGTSTEDHSRIYKIDPATGSVLARGPVISIRHGNDMTYDSKTGKLIVVWSSYDTVSVIDTDEYLESGEKNPNYLGIKETYSLTGRQEYTTLIPDGNGGYTTTTIGFHGLGYDEVGDRYVCATSSATQSGFGLVAFRITEDGITDVSVIETPKTGYTKQGADCDSYYVYHAQSYPSGTADKANTVVVATWDGAYARTLKIPYPDSGTNNIEIETIMWVGGNAYMNANRGGSTSLARLSINYNY